LNIKTVLCALFVIATSSVFVSAHSEAATQGIFQNPYFLLFFPLGIILLGAYISEHFEKTRKDKKEVEKIKKLLFVSILLVTIFFSLFIFISTLTTNMQSWTRGPVHWHADLNIEICGEEFLLPSSKGWQNKVGTNLLHTHNDNRMHIEGVIMEREDATLGKFLGEQGIPFSSEQIADMKNGYLCNDGLPGKVQLYVNGEKNLEYEDYLISPYATVPPGDKIRIVFEGQP